MGDASLAVDDTRVNALTGEGGESPRKHMV